MQSNKNNDIFSLMKFFIFTKLAKCIKYTYYSKEKRLKNQKQRLTTEKNSIHALHALCIFILLLWLRRRRLRNFNCSCIREPRHKCSDTRYSVNRLLWHFYFWFRTIIIIMLSLLSRLCRFIGISLSPPIVYLPNAFPQ